MSKDKTDEVLEKIKDLDDLLTDRISDFHEVKGAMQARHVYMYYRKLLWEIRDIIESK